MKILICTGIYPPDIGGPAIYTERIAREFLKYNHKVRVLTYSDDCEDEIIKDGYRLIFVKRGNRIGNYFRYFLQVLKYSKGADVIYLQDTVSAGLPTSLANLFLKKNLVLKIVGDYAWEMGGNKVTSTLDNFYPFEGDKYDFKIELLQRIQTWVAKQADKIITPSVYLKRIVNEGWGIDGKKINVVYNAIKPTPEFKFQISDFRDRNLILSIGRLVPWKGFGTLIEMMTDLLKENSEFRLEIVGDGPERENLKNLIKLRNLENRVEFLGRLAHVEVIKKLKSTGIFVLNTRYEGLSHILIEALACGVPIVTTSVGGNSEIVENNENGFLVPFNDKEELKEKILKIWRDENLQEKFKQNGYNNLGKFDLNKMVENTLKALSFRREYLKVLMISADETILDLNSVSAGRMRDYGTICDELHIIVFNSKKIVGKIQLGDNIWVYPTDSFIKPWAILDAISIGKSIIEKNNISVITAQNPHEAGLVGYVLKRRFKIGLNIQLHGDFFGSDYWRKSSLLNWVRDKLGRFIIKEADSIRTVSNSVKNGLMRQFNISDDKIIFVPIFADIEKIRQTHPTFNLKDKYPNKHPIFLSVGRLEDEKNYPFVFRLFKKLLCDFPNALLIVVGEGSQKYYLVEEIKRLCIEENVKFEGKCEELVSYYKTVDICLSPSKSEGWGRTLIESAAAGCPMILSHSFAAGEIISEKEVRKALIMEDNKIEEWYDAIRELLENSVFCDKITRSLSYEVNKLPNKQQTLNLIKESWRVAL